MLTFGCLLRITQLCCPTSSLKMTRPKRMDLKPKRDQDLLAQCYGSEPGTLQDLGSHLTCAFCELWDFGQAVLDQGHGFPICKPVTRNPLILRRLSRGLYERYEKICMLLTDCVANTSHSYLLLTTLVIHLFLTVIPSISFSYGNNIIPHWLRFCETS